MKLNLSRRFEANGATLGILGGLSRTLYTLEEAWRENKREISCVPTGAYHCVAHGWEEEMEFKKLQTWQLLAVPGRSDILIHTGNYTKNTEGCILAGMGLQVSQVLSMVTDTRMAMDLLRKEIGQNSFTLTIE